MSREVARVQGHAPPVKPPRRINLDPGTTRVGPPTGHRTPSGSGGRARCRSWRPSAIRHSRRSWPASLRSRRSTKRGRWRRGEGSGKRGGTWHTSWPCSSTSHSHTCRWPCGIGSGAEARCGADAAAKQDTSGRVGSIYHCTRPGGAVPATRRAGTVWYHPWSGYREGRPPNKLRLSIVARCAVQPTLGAGVLATHGLPSPVPGPSSRTRPGAHSVLHSAREYVLVHLLCSEPVPTRQDPVAIRTPSWGLHVHSKNSCVQQLPRMGRPLRPEGGDRRDYDLSLPPNGAECFRT